MIARIATRLTNALGKYVSMTDDEAEVYQYGFDIALYTLLSTTALLVIGALAGKFVSTIICVSLFYLNQSIGGGYHANSHLGCFVTMIMGLAFYLVLDTIRFATGIYYFCGAVSLSVLMIKPLVLHKNKRYLENRRTQLELHSRLIVLFETLLFGLLVISRHEKLLSAFSLSLLLCAVSRMVAWFISNKDTSG